VDPDYDTGKRLKEFADLFDPSLIALRHDSKEILHEVLRSFYVPAALTPEERK